MAYPLTLDDVPWISLKGSNLKCFSDAQGFERIDPVNVIIGRNNSGKSTLLDLVQHAVEGGSPVQSNNRLPEISFSCPLTRKVAARYGSQMSFQRGGSFEELAIEHFDGARLTWTNNEARNQTLVKTLLEENPTSLHESYSAPLLDHFTKNFGNPFDKLRFSRILADRDISVETIETTPADPLQALMSNGQNATRLITRYLNDANLDRSVVEAKILTELNSIFRPDASFLRIVPLRREGGEWEVHLDEPNKGLIPLSRAGSGIKTVMLVLMHLYLVPDVLGRSGTSAVSLSDFLFGFEELENNLHPSLQRRLFLHLRDVAEREGCKFFITTHSHVVIDLFSRDPKAQIVHVYHDGERATATRITTYVGHRSVFQDLEVRASDLLQANAVVWVEGPSDRIYFNKWVELWSEGQLQEHVDYEVAFTAGTLLAHYTFEAPETERERIEALRINGNAVILIDSDKLSADADLKARAERVVREIGDMEGVAWVTAGKEVENYIPSEILGDMLGDDSLEPPGQFASVFEYIKGQGVGDFLKRKVELAERVCEALTREMIAAQLDLAEKLDMVCGKLRAWNHRTAG